MNIKQHKYKMFFKENWFNIQKANNKNYVDFMDKNDI